MLIAGHDLGKLGAGWQEWAHQWQKIVEKEVSLERMLAHTDYDASEEQKKLQKKLGARPPHAAESAFGLLYVSAELFKEYKALFKAVNTAITRHHSATHKGNVQTFKGAGHAQSALQDAFNDVGLANLSLEAVQWEFTEADASLRKWLVEPESPNQMLLYFLFARILRLADQRSQKAT